MYSLCSPTFGKCDFLSCRVPDIQTQNVSKNHTSPQLRHDGRDGCTAYQRLRARKVWVVRRDLLRNQVRSARRVDRKLRSRDTTRKPSRHVAGRLGGSGAPAGAWQVPRQPDRRLFAAQPPRLQARSTRQSQSCSLPQGATRRMRRLCPKPDCARMRYLRQTQKSQRNIRTVSLVHV